MGAGSARHHEKNFDEKNVVTYKSPGMPTLTYKTVSALSSD
jgi:hypothetical protein